MNIKKNHSNKTRTNGESLKDQYYTKEEVIRKCISHAKPFLKNATSCLDFSAGNNVFIKNMKIEIPSILSYYA